MPFIDHSDNPPPLPIATGVEYRPIPGFPGYIVGTNARVFSCRYGPWRELNRRLATDGYVYVNFRPKGQPHVQGVHRLMLLAFVGPCPPGMETRHLDGVRNHNELSNLAWGTRDENAADRVRHGTSNKGQTNGRSKLKDQQAAEIKQLLAGSAMPIRLIAERFEVTAGLILLINRGTAWEHLPSPTGSHPIRRLLIGPPRGPRPWMKGRRRPISG